MDTLWGGALPESAHAHAEQHVRHRALDRRDVGAVVDESTRFEEDRHRVVDQIGRWRFHCTGKLHLPWHGGKREVRILLKNLI